VQVDGERRQATVRHSLLILPAVILALGSVSLSATAGSLGGAVGGVSGGAGGTVSGAVGGVDSAIDGTVAGAGSTVTGTKATVTALTQKGVLNATARSDLIGGIKAKLEVLSKKNLAKLCVGIGGGSGCGTGHSRHQ
jgi:hypothetical protein